ncbi:protein inturned-like [Babylonia areolata]|uniref:protein inturned-like n=1 Tax=Babylonia areolata TaxID=304850 RepID=UPI003FD42831
MSYFPSFGPFYDPIKEQEVYRDNDGSLRVRSRPLTPAGVGVSTARRLETQTGNSDRVPKIESKWSEHVRPNQGDLFYIDVDGKTRARSNSLPQPPPLAPPPSAPSTDADLSRQNGGRHSDSAVAPSRFQRGSASEEDEEERLRSRSELRKKSKQLQQALHRKQDRLKNGEVKSVEQLRKSRSANNGETESDLPEQNHSRMLLSQTADKADRVNGQAQGHKHTGASQQQKNSPHFKDVILVPDFSRHTDSASKLASGAELFELLLGIALCRYRQRSAATGSREGGESHGESKERKLVVQGVVTGSPADKSGNVHRGDMLLYLNGQEVTWSNLNNVVHGIKREVRLTFQVPKIIGPTACSQGLAVSNGSSRLPAYHNLCLLVTGRDIFNLQQQLRQHSCIALYLTLSGGSGGEETPNDDIVYSFPPQEEALTDIRGLFLTLNSSLQDSVQSGADISTLVVGEETVNVAYYQQGRDIFIMAAPSLRVPLCLLRGVMSDVCRMLTTVFGSVDRAFHGGESSQLDQVFALFFHRLLGLAGVDNCGDGGDSESLSLSAPSWLQLSMDGMCAAPSLLLSEENRLICDEILSEFEAADFDDFIEENELYQRRSFTVLGSCLFYKKYLVCSHLPASDLRDVYGFLKCHSLLTLASRQPIDELVVWQEMHLTRRASPTATDSMPVGYREPEARWFMLIVGMKHFMLATVLEAGGCSRGAVGKPGPHPLLVDQARATLVQLDTQDLHMSHCCQDRLLEEQDSPLTTSPERFVTHAKQVKDDAGNVVKSSVTSKPPSPGRSGNEGPFKYRSSPRSDRRPATDSDAGSETGAMIRQGSKLSYGSNDSGGSGSSTGAPKPKTGRFSSLLDVSSIGRSMSALHIDTIGTPGTQGKLSRGRDNVVFHFIHYNDLEGVLVTSADLDLSLAPARIQSEVMANFHRCVLNLRAAFSERSLQTVDIEKSQSVFQRDCASTQGVQEQGVLFQCSAPATLPDNPRVAALLTYWVVGRRFTSGPACHELYVCFHESSSQSMVDMAFSLGFGS